MKTILRLAAVVCLCVASHLHAASTINNTNAFAWGANIGWTNWHDAAVGAPAGPNGVVIGEFICQGWIYGANVGWISMGRTDVVGNPLGPVNNIQYSNTGTDFGVNYTIDPAVPGVAFLRGLAYGANIGWVNFDAPGFPFPGGVLKPQISFATGQLSGYAYSANCGWIPLSALDEAMVLRFVQTDYVAKGVDSDMDGLADAFEFQYLGGLGGDPSVDSDGDGMTNLEEYQEGTNPAVANDRLRILALAPNTGGTSTPLTWSSTPARLYQIETTTALSLSPPTTWTLNTTFNTHGTGTFAPDAGTMTTRTILEGSPSTKRFYRAKSVRPLPPP